MPYIWYAGTPSDFGADDVTVYGTNNLVQFTAVTLDIYLERDTGSTLLDTSSMTDDGDTPVNQVSGAAGEVIWFKCDNTVTGDRDVFGTPDSGTTWYRFSPNNDSLVDRMVAVEAAGTPDMDDLGDVSATSPSNGDGLYYNSTSQLWVAGVGSGTSLPSGGTDGQFLAKQSAADGDADWETHYTVPSGGADEALLAKASASDGDTEWVAGTTYWKVWTGSATSYSAIGSPDANTLYAITS